MRLLQESVLPGWERLLHCLAQSSKQEYFALLDTAAGWAVSVPAQPAGQVAHTHTLEWDSTWCIACQQGESASVETQCSSCLETPDIGSHQLYVLFIVAEFG